MNKKDIEQITTLFNQGFARIWEDNLEPALTALEIRFDQKLEARIAPLPTKAYLDEKLSGLEGRLTIKIRSADEKIGRLVGILKRKDVLDDSDLNEIGTSQPFPR